VDGSRHLLPFLGDVHVQRHETPGAGDEKLIGGV
jgi:hypothetical protein